MGGRTRHPWFDPMEQLLIGAGKKEVQIIPPKIGQRIDTNRLPEMEFWWRSIDNRRNDHN